MESGKTAVTIIIVAMIVTAGLGFFANIKDQSATVTEYNTIGTMDAFFSANSQPTTVSEIYNSPYNITGWSGDLDTTYTVLPEGRANQYVFREESETYTSNITEYDFSEHGYVLSGTYTGRSGSGPGLQQWTSDMFKTSLSDSESVYLAGSDGADYDRGDLYIRHSTSSGTVTGYDYYGEAVGGYGQNTEFTGGVGTTTERTLYKSFSIAFNGEVVASPTLTTPFFVTSLDNLVGSQPLTANTRIYVADGEIKFIGNYTSTYSYTYNSSGSTSTVNGMLNVTGVVSNNVAYLRYNPATEHWIAYNSTNVRLWDSANVGIYMTDAHQFEIDIRQYTVIPPVYFDPTRYVGIDGTAEWSNYARNNSLVNTEVTFLWKGTGTIQVNTGGPILDIVNTGSAYYVRTSLTTSFPLGTYIGLEITLSSTNNEVLIRGILSEQTTPIEVEVEGVTTEVDVPSTMNYVASSVVYTVNLYDSDDTDEVTPNLPEYIYKLIFNSADGYGYISETYILSDPNQLLWSNINLDLLDYFEEYSSDMRVLLQGFVRYGTSIAINGTTYPVVNNSITVHVVEVIRDAQEVRSEETNEIIEVIPATTREYDVKFTLGGLAIDYTQGHVYLVQTNGSAKVDLGAVQSYDLVFNGIWFFSSSLSTINQYQSTVKVWNPGWDMDVNTTILLFVGTIIGLGIVVLARFRDMVSGIDIAILIGAIAIALTMVTV